METIGLLPSANSTRRPLRIDLALLQQIQGILVAGNIQPAQGMWLRERKLRTRRSLSGQRPPIA